MTHTVMATHGRLILFSTLATAIHAAAFHGLPHPFPLTGAAKAQAPVIVEISFTSQTATEVQKTPQPETQPLQEISLQTKPASELQKHREPAKKVARQEKPIAPEKKTRPHEVAARKTARLSIEPASQSPETISHPVIVVADSHTGQQQETLFINELLDQIEKNKFYPEKARRRNIQGNVKVELELDDKGNIVSLKLSDGHKILRKATQTAIQATAPFNAPPLSLGSPRVIHFGVQYQFR